MYIKMYTQHRHHPLPPSLHLPTLLIAMPPPSLPPSHLPTLLIAMPPTCPVLPTTGSALQAKTRPSMCTMLSSVTESGTCRSWRGGGMGRWDGWEG